MVIPYIDLGTLHKEQTFDFSEYVQEGGFYSDVTMTESHSHF